MSTTRCQGGANLVRRDSRERLAVHAAAADHAGHCAVVSSEGCVGTRSFHKRVVRDQSQISKTTSSPDSHRTQCAHTLPLIKSSAALRTFMASPKLRWNSTYDTRSVGSPGAPATFCVCCCSRVKMANRSRMEGSAFLALCGGMRRVEAVCGGFEGKYSLANHQAIKNEGLCV